MTEPSIRVAVYANIPSTQWGRFLRRLGLNTRWGIDRPGALLAQGEEGVHQEAVPLERGKMYWTAAHVNGKVIEMRPERG